MDKDYHRRAIPPQMDDHHGKGVPLNQVEEVLAVLLRSVGTHDGVRLGVQVHGVKLVSRGASKNYQNITRRIHMGTNAIMVCFMGIVMRSASQVMVSMKFRDGRLMTVSKVQWTHRRCFSII